MALAETAKLVTELDLKDQDFQTGMAKASQSAVSYGRATDQAATKTGFLGRSMKGASGAMHHFGGRVSQVTQLLGAGGLLGGVLGITVAVKHGVDAAQEWGRTTDRLRQLTGASTKEASQFSDAFDKLGIKGEQQIRIIGFMIKTLGNLNQDTKKARELSKEYGFQLMDGHGKVKDAFTIIQDFTGYFNNKHIPAYQKASLGAKLFGRGWTDLIPIFEQGKKKMDRAMKDSMSLNDEQVKDIHRYRDAQRDLNDTIGDLSVKIGLAAMPAITELTKGISGFIEKNDRKIRLIFGQMLEGAKAAAGFIMNELVPTLSSLAGTAVGFWNGLPGPLRDLMVKGFVADRAVKFAFGFSITGLATDALKDAIGGGLSRVFGRGSSPATPMYVKPVGVGGMGGAGGVAGGGGRLGGMLGKVGLIGEAVGLTAMVGETINQFMQDRSAEQADLQNKANGLLGDKIEKSLDDVTNMTRLMAEADPAKKAGIQTFASKELKDALRNVGTNIVDKITDANRGDAIQKLIAAQEQAISYGWQDVADKLGADIAKLQSGGGGGGGDSVTSILRAIREQQAESGSSFMDAATVVGDRMVAAGKNVDDATSNIGKLFNKAVAKGEDDIARSSKQMRVLERSFARAQRTNDKGLARAAELLKDGVAGDRENSGKVRQAIRIMEREQKQALRDGHRTLARNLGRDIQVLRRTTQTGLGSATQKLGTIAAKPPPTVNVTTNVTATVGVRDVEKATTTVNRYGRTAV